MSENRLCTETIKAAGRGNLSEVRRIVSKNWKILQLYDQKGLTPLHHAVRGDHAEVVKYILNFGFVDTNVRDNEGNTSLHTAVAASAVRCISLLLHSGADPNIKNNQNSAPIHLCIVLDTQESLKALLAHSSVDADLPGELKLLPLHYAANFDRPECAKILLEAGSDMRKTCAGGYNSVHMAAYNSSAKTLEELINYGSDAKKYMAFRDPDNNTPLHAAVNSADIETIKVCLKAGAVIDAQQDDLSTPVHLACAQGNAQMVEVMFELQKDNMKSAIDMQDSMGMTPLHRAAIFDHVDVVALLIDNGADINSQDSLQRSPILLAASKGSWNTMHLLVQHGADVTIKDLYDRSFIHIAILNGINRQELSCDDNSFIISQIDEKDIDGCTPLHYASKNGFLDVIDNLITLGANVTAKNHAKESPFHIAARYGRFKTCKILLNSKLGSHVMNAKNALGYTALHIASLNGHTKIVSLLLQRGCSITRCYDGNTALHHAARNCYTRCMQCMLTIHGNLINYANRQGDTALHTAAKECKTSAVILLLSDGADISKNNEGCTFFEYIVANKQEELAKAVIKHDRWQEVLDNSSKNCASMLGLIEHLPSVCLDVLDRCQTFSNYEQTSDVHTITYNFKYVQNYCTKQSLHQSDGSKCIPLAAMNTMVLHGRVDCLSHPVCSNYVNMKWKAYGIWLHMGNLLVYGLFLTLLTWFVVEYRFPDVQNERNASSTENDNLATVRERTALPYAVIYILASYAFLNMIKEFFQMLHQGKLYFTEFSNVHEWSLYISTAIFALKCLIDDNGSYHKEIAAIVVFLAWFNLLLFLQRFAFFGIYIVMFLEILTTFITVICVFSILIIAFGLTFYILLADDYENTSHLYPGMSMIRVMMMMLELDYMSSFNKPFNDKDPNTLPLSNLSIVFLVLFVLLMPILLMNLMIGLAVGDIDSIQKDARLKRLAKQVEIHTCLESKLPRRFLDRVEKTEHVHVFRLNGDKSKIAWFLIKVKNTFGDNSVRSDVNSASQHALSEYISKQKPKMNEISTLMKKQYDQLRLIVQKLEIRSEDDFLDEGVWVKDNPNDRIEPQPIRSLSFRVRSEMVRKPNILFQLKQDEKDVKTNGELYDSVI